MSADSNDVEMRPIKRELLDEEDDEEADEMDPQVRQARKRKLREKMLKFEADLKGKVENNEKLTIEEMADSVKTACSKKHFNEIRETLDGKQVSQDSHVMLTASKMLLQNMEILSNQGVVCAFSARKFTQKMKRFSSLGVKKNQEVPSSAVNPLMVDDEERPSEDALLRMKPRAADLTGLNIVEWAFSGRHVKNLLKKGPAAEFLLPLIDPNDVDPTLLKTRKTAVRRTIKAEEKTVLKNKTQAENGSDEAAVSKELDILCKCLRKLFKRRRVKQIGYYELAINPHSFAKTIENMFYLSTLSKDNYITVDLDDDGLPVVSLTSSHNRKLFEKADPLRRKQSVLGFSYQMWEQMKSDLNLTEPAINRDDLDDDDDAMMR